jgi:hypothetical protein
LGIPTRGHEAFSDGVDRLVRRAEEREIARRVEVGEGLIDVEIDRAAIEDAHARERREALLAAPLDARVSSIAKGVRDLRSWTARRTRTTYVREHVFLRANGSEFLEDAHVSALARGVLAE